MTARMILIRDVVGEEMAQTVKEQIREGMEGKGTERGGIKANPLND
jgi:hypothetical protein